jgi:hypothetical protein
LSKKDLLISKKDKLYPYLNDINEDLLPVYS